MAISSYLSSYYHSHLNWHIVIIYRNGHYSKYYLLTIILPTYRHHHHHHHHKVVLFDITNKTRHPSTQIHSENSQHLHHFPWQIFHGNRGLKLLKLLKTPPPSLLPPSGPGSRVVDGISACILCVWSWWKQPKQAPAVGKMGKNHGHNWRPRCWTRTHHWFHSHKSFFAQIGISRDIRDTYHVGMLMETDSSPQNIIESYTTKVAVRISA